MERLEHEVDLGDGFAGRTTRPALDVERHAGTPVGARLIDLLADHSNPALAEVYRTEVGRTQRLLHAHAAAIEWSLDEGMVTAAERKRPISELELEFKGGDPQGLYATAREWQARHGLWLDVISKAQRGNLLVEGEGGRAARQGGAASGWQRKAARRMDGETMLRTIVAACLSQILPNASELAGGSRDPEHVHQLRVGLRRLRSALRELDGAAGSLADDWKPPVLAVFDALGRVRDRQVFVESLAPRLARAGAPPMDPADDSGADEVALQELVRGVAFQGALLRLLAFAHGQGGGAARRRGDRSGAPFDPLADLRKRLTRLARQVTRDADRFEALPFDEQHRVRKRLKRLRYLAEFVAPLFKSRAVDAWAGGRLQPAQDALGQHVDLCLAAQRMAAAAVSDPRAWFGVGWLRAQAGESARAGRKSLQRLKRADAFW